MPAAGLRCPRGSRATPLGAAAPAPTPTVARPAAPRPPEELSGPGVPPCSRCGDSSPRRTWNARGALSPSHVLVPRARSLRETRPPRGFCATAHLGRSLRAPLRDPPRPECAAPGAAGRGLGVGDSALPGRCPAAPGFERALPLGPAASLDTQRRGLALSPPEAALLSACASPVPPVTTSGPRAQSEPNQPTRTFLSPSPCPSPAAHSRQPPAVSPVGSDTGAGFRLVYTPAGLRARGDRDYTWVLTDPGGQERKRTEQG